MPVPPERHMPQHSSHALSSSTLSLSRAPIPPPYTCSWINNIIAYPSSGYALHNGYNGQVGTPGQGILDGYEQRLIGNVLVSPRDGEYALPICSGRGKTIMANNTIYSPTGNVSECGMTLAQWQAQGNDLGTTGSPFPDDSVVLGVARKILGLPGAA